MRPDSRIVAELHATLGKLQVALGAIDSAIVLVSEAGLVQWCNAPFDRLVGRSRLEILGEPVERIFPLGSGEHPARAALSRDAETRDFVREGRELEVYAAAVRMPESAPSVVLVLRDVTERRKAEADLRAAKERAEEANAELELFSFAVAHDLRSPLRKIESFGELLERECWAALSPEGREHLRRMREGARRLDANIQSLLSLAKDSARELSPAPVDLSALAEGILAELGAQDPGRKVSARVAPGQWAHGDETLLRSVLQNLLHNAWKATAANASAAIEFGVTADGAYFVKDDGLGFPPELGQRLFKPFSRLHEPRRFPGMGIGLASVQRVVARHGGRVWAESREGAGATFFFTLRR